MNPEQIGGLVRTVLASLGGIVSGWLIAKGVSATDANTIVAALVALVSTGATAFWSIKTKTPVAMAQSLTANHPGTIVVGSQALSDATPRNESILSHAEATVTVKP